MAQNRVQMHLRCPFYPGLLLQPEMDLDWVFGPPLLRFIVWPFDLCLRPRLFGKWASFSFHGFLVFLGPFIHISIYVLL
jgi:hypothetical protein